MTPDYFMILPDRLEKIVDAIQDKGGVCMIVGGAVRDHLMGITPKDYDIEVYYITYVDLEKILSSQFKVDAVGRAFGVLKVTVDGETFDVALPRRENKSGSGHRGFVVESDPNMSYEEASARRDFTINSIMWDCRDGKYIDCYNGRKDLADKVLRHVSDHFDEDPLRVLRGCQFAARFGFTIDAATMQKCFNLQNELKTLPVERIWEEFKKLLLKSPRPSAGLDAMIDTGAIDLFPELKALLHVNQDPEWHPEGQDHPYGSLWIHNGMVTDSAVRVLNDDQVTDETERLIVMLGAMCHDLGKPAVTQMVDNRWRAHAHEEAGSEPTRAFLARIGCPPGIVEAVVPLVENHLKPFHFARDRAGNSAIRRLALKVPLERLCRVARADFLGRTTAEALACTDSREIEDIKWLLEQASTLKVVNSGPKPLLMGRHLLAFGMKQGPEMGKILKEAFEAQLDGAFSDENGAIEWYKANHAGT